MTLNILHNTKMKKLYLFMFKLWIKFNGKTLIDTYGVNNLFS